ncbi:MAG: hypothetical protein AAF586_08725 [Planctomycetota bacterium]
MTIIERWTNGGRPIDRGTVICMLFLGLIFIGLPLILLVFYQPAQGSPFRGKVISVESQMTGIGANRRIKWDVEVDVEDQGPRRYKFHRFADSKAKLLNTGDQIEFFVDDQYISALVVNGELLMSYDQYSGSIWRWYYLFSCCSVVVALGLVLLAANWTLRWLGLTRVALASTESSDLQ